MFLITSQNFIKNFFLKFWAAWPGSGLNSVKMTALLADLEAI